MEEFFRNIAKFFGGLVGDEETNAGIAIHAPGDYPDKGAYENRIPLPFTFTDSNNDTRSGIMYVPYYANRDINDKLKRNDNSEAIEFYGMELDDGTELNYEQGKDFLNSLSPDRFAVQTQAVRTDKEEQDHTPAYSAGRRGYLDWFQSSDKWPYKRATVKDTDFIENLRDAMKTYRSPRSSDAANVPSVEELFNRYNLSKRRK